MKRREFAIKSSMATGLGLASSNLFFNINKPLQKSDTVIGHGDYKYKVVKEWGNLDPTKVPILNCHEMVMDSKGRLIMVTDEIKNNIIIYDKSGKLIDSWGTWFPGGHGLTLSKEGDEDFLFVADCGWHLSKEQKWEKQEGRILKMTTDGKLVFNIGHPSTIGVYDKDQPFMPTEIAVAPNGDFYVADGYGSDYILQYNAEGEFIRKFGGNKEGQKEEKLANAHGVAVDLRDPNNPVLICTSRNDNAFKYFTMDGKYIKTIELPGLYVCRPVIDDNNIYAGVCWSKTREGKGWVQDTGFVTVLEDDKVVSNPGGTAPEYVGGKLQPMFKDSDIFNHGHDVCVDEDKNLYVCQWNANKSYPIKLERV